MLKIEFEYKKGILFVRLIGELNKSTKTKLELVDDMIKKAGIKYLLINLEKTIIINDVELNNMIKKYKNLIGNDGRLLICGYYNRLNIKLKKDELDEIWLANKEVNAFKIINI